MINAFRLPNGRLVTIKSYVKAWKTLRSMDPNAMIPGWDDFPTEAWRVLREMRRGMHDRINRHMLDHGKGRKWTDDWFFAAFRCARDVNTPRLIVRWVPAEFRSRLAGRLTTTDDL